MMGGAGGRTHWNRMCPSVQAGYFSVEIQGADQMPDGHFQKIAPCAAETLCVCQLCWKRVPQVRTPPAAPPPLPKLFQMSLVDLAKKLLEGARAGQDDEVHIWMANGALFTADWLNFSTSPGSTVRALFHYRSTTSSWC